jgi:anti-sigma B factor antagonist
MGASHHEGMARRGERVERSSGAAPPLHSGASDLLEITVENGTAGVSVLSLAGELDLSTVPKLERPLLRELDERNGVVVDLTRLSFIDSSGIGLLIQAFRVDEDRPRLHTVIARGSQIERVFRIAGIDRALPLYFDRDEALATVYAGRNGDRGG